MPPSLIKTFYKPAYFLPPGVRHLVFATFARHPRDSSKLKRCAGDRVIPGKRYRSDQRKVVAKRRVSWGGMARSRIETDRQKLATSRPCPIEYTAKLSRLSTRGQTPLSSISRPGEDSWLGQEAATSVSRSKAVSTRCFTCQPPLSPLLSSLLVISPPLMYSWEGEATGCIHSGCYKVVVGGTG